jgi:MOSC domain-containing protein YiiM
MTDIPADGSLMPRMRLVSVNVGRPRPVSYRDGTVSTGIYKEPVAGPVWVHRLNLDGDGQADLKVHGGEHKAVYAYPFEHYALWQRELGRNDFAHGQFGENLTVEGLIEDAVYIGDVYRIGEALLQVSQPRSPCFKLGIRMGDAQFPARFTAENRTGFYLRVLEEGRVAAGDEIEHIEQAKDSISVRDAFRLRHGSGGTRAEYERAARVSALTPSWRSVFEKCLAKAR